MVARTVRRCRIAAVERSKKLGKANSYKTTSAKTQKARKMTAATAAASAAIWYAAIPTPIFQGILNHQNLSEDTCRWIYILMGRMLYCANHDAALLDDWGERPLAFVGLSGTGKTVIQRFFQQLLPKGAVKVEPHNENSTKTSLVMRKVRSDGLALPCMLTGRFTHDTNGRLVIVRFNVPVRTRRRNYDLLFKLIDNESEPFRTKISMAYRAYAHKPAPILS